MSRVGSIGKNIPLLIKQGCTFAFKLHATSLETGEPIDLTGYSIEAQIRKTPKSEDIAATFSYTIIDAEEGWFSLRLTDEETAAIPAGETSKSDDSRYRWDCEATSPDGDKYPVAYGSVLIEPEITR